MKKILINIALIALLIVCPAAVPQALTAADNYSMLKSSFDDLYPGKNLLIDTLDINGLKLLILRHLETSPAIAALLAQDQSSEYSYRAIEESHKPSIDFGFSFSGYDSYYREVEVYKNVPVKWDNENPVISNITLPNGGQGIIWLPRPIGWEYKNIPLNASIDYANKLTQAYVSMNYKFLFGLEITPLSYSVDYRLKPKTYGFPWSANLTTGFMLPLFKNFGYMGSTDYIQMQMNKINSKINDASLKSYKAQVISAVMSDYFNLYFQYRRIVSLDSLRSILSVQILDVDLLTKESRVTISENINIKNQKRNIDFQINNALNEYIYLCSKLNIDPVNADDFYVYIPKLSDIDKIIMLFFKHFNERITPQNLKKLIYEHPQVNISQYSLEQYEYQLEYAKNQRQPEINLLANFGTFEVNQLGFGDLGRALEKSVTRPDGITWNLGVQYHLPFGNSDELNYKSAVSLIQSQEQQLENSKKMLNDKLEDYIYNIRNAMDNIENSQNAFRAVKDIIDREAFVLFENKRLNRYDYNSYINELENSKLTLNNSRKLFFNYYFMFVNDMNIDINTVLSDLE